MSDEKEVKDLVNRGRYEFSRHAEREREADKILVREFEDALRNCEIKKIIQMILGGQVFLRWVFLLAGLFTQYAL